MPVRASGNGDNSVRRYSCPPLSPPDLYYGFWWHEGRNECLKVDPSLLHQYSARETLVELSSRGLYLLNKKYILKLYPPYIDVDAIVRTMRLASHIVPVPRVRRYGRSGNCCFIIMDFLSGNDLIEPGSLEKVYPPWALEARVEYHVRDLVRRLQRSGISHNDMYLSNIFIDRYCRISAVIDWDFARREPYGEEYLRRLTQDYRPHSWDYIFARDLRPFGSGFVASPVDAASDIEPFDPYLPSSTIAQDANVEHVLDPLEIPVAKPWRKRIVLLVGSDGSNVSATLDHKRDGQEFWSLKGYELARAFTSQPVSEDYVRKLKIPATSYDDILPLGTSREQEFARLVVRESPDVVLLINWHLPLSTFFFEAMSVPMDLCEPASLPVVLRLNLVHAPVAMRPKSADEANSFKVTAVATMVQGYAQPEFPLHVHQTPAFDVTADGEFSKAMFAAQREVARAMVSTWGARSGT